MKRDGPINLLIVEASGVFGGKLAYELRRQPGIHVAAVVPDALQARRSVLQHHPDVILLDLDLPRMDGLEFLRRLREAYPVPVIACTGTAPRDGPRAVRAAELGALDVVIKPAPGNQAAIRALAQELAQMIRVAAAEARPVPAAAVPPEHERLPLSFRAAGISPSRYIVVLGASTGGPEAVRALLASASPDFPPVVVVQHMPAMFTSSFAERLNRCSPLKVTEAVEGQPLVSGSAVVARGDTHLTVQADTTGWRAHYTDQQRVNLHCPSVEVLFDSAVAVARSNAIGILLTGMGADGAHGLLRIRQHGGVTIAQDARSSVVYGMPKIAVQLGAVLHTGRPEDIPGIVLRALLSREQSRRVAAVQA